ncbi:unnamed protein product [Darwinula stevensoni]|uniref:Transmembrane protein n=1 Tax=Darwinula stevensoni TaxID=69355 RepID=A0A7R9AFQ1_9CRUS|nr:unnamed protein product [Darwinula stevensoni]CAG0903086.1 unnamed protein product [Darwinula stevensoni]
MEAADIEFFRARDRRRKVAYAIACVSIVAVVITLSLCLSPIANPGNIEMIALGIVQAVIGVTIFSFAIVHYVCKASVERERRRRGPGASTDGHCASQSTATPTRMRSSHPRRGGGSQAELPVPFQPRRLTDREKGSRADEHSTKTCWVFTGRKDSSGFSVSFGFSFSWSLTCIAGGFDPDAYWSPRVAIVYLEKPLRRGRVHAVVGGAGVSSGARLGKVHPSALARVLGKAVLYGGSLQPGQPLVFLVKEPPRSTAMCPVLVCEDSS